MTRAAKGAGARNRDQTDEILPALGPNLRRLRSQRGLSLERLARRSGVSRAMLSQIELGQSAPTINVLWKVARALEVPFSGLIERSHVRAPSVLPARSGQLLTNQDGTFTLPRALSLRRSPPPDRVLRAAPQGPRARSRRIRTRPEPSRTWW